MASMQKVPQQPGAVTSLIASLTNSPNKKIALAAVVILLLWGSTRSSKRAPAGERRGSSQSNEKRKGRGNVDAMFWNRLAKLVKIVLPGWNSREARHIYILNILLVIRTMMSIWLADVNGKVVKAIVNKSFPEFLQRIFHLFLFAVPSSMINSGIDYIQKKLSLLFRARLTKYFHKHYLNNMHYYKICNLDNRIANPDQRLTQDADKWSSSLASLYINFVKPFLDMFLFSKKLSELVGWEGPAITFAWYGFSGWIIRLISPAFGRLTAQEQRLEGEYRSLHSNLLTHSEEVAFYNGHEWEQRNIDNGFDRLYSHISFVLKKRFLMGIYDSMLVKYGAVMVGYTVVGLPVFGPKSGEYLAKFGNDQAQITKDYVRNSSLLINLAKAIGRLVVSYKEVQNLAGYTTLIHEMDQVLEDLSGGHYQRVMVTQAPEDGAAITDGPKGDAVFKQTTKGAKIVFSDDIIFEDIPILSPNGDVLIEKMSFKIQPGMHVLISGPNGCGKSSLFRILGELWPAKAGTLTKPPVEKVFYIPQRPYLPNGTLRDQVIYPHTIADMKAKGVSEDDLQKIMDNVRLAHVVAREKDGWNTHNDWADVLSGGEKQRIAMARLIYHKPLYAILDECTSAVSIDVEGHLYSYMKEMGITLITVSHRETLWKYHDHLLKFYGDRQYSFGPMPEDKRVK